MKKVLKILAVLIAVIVIAVGILFLVNNEKEPIGQTGNEADELARKMMLAVNKPAWDSTHYIQWTFKGMHTFVWDKDRHFCKVSWDDKEVLLNINQISGKAFAVGQPLSGEAASEQIRTAWGYFCNDSFWLNAVVKAFDPGTERSIVTLGDGSKGLKVQYTQGGVTPGDAYVWILDEQNRPVAWKMWVEIIPMGGMKFSWEKWTTLSTGAVIATFHDSAMLDLDISDLKAGNSYADFGFGEDPFAGI